MSGTAINTFTNGSTEEVSFTSMQQTILNAIKSQDDFSFINFEVGNTAALGIAAGSVITVNFVQYRFDVNELFNLLTADGSVTAYSAAPDGEYYIVAVADGNGHCTGYMRSIASPSVAFNVEFGGLYEAGTQHRIIGGITKKNGLSTDKWIQRVRLGTKPSYHREYVTGHSITAREIVGASKAGLCGTFIDLTVQRSFGNENTELGEFEVKYPCLAVIECEYMSNAASGSGVLGGNLSLYSMDTGCVMPGTLPLYFIGSLATSKMAVALMPGTYSLHASTVTWLVTAHSTAYIYIKTLKVHSYNVFGSTVGI